MSLQRSMTLVASAGGLYCAAAWRAAGQAKGLCHTVKSHSVANSGTNSGCSISKGSVACGLYPILVYHIFRNSLLG